MSASWADVTVSKGRFHSADTANVDNHLESEGFTLGLLKHLDTEGINYCHWKSNVRLDGTLTGREDIDILVEKSDLAAFKRILLEKDFKFARARLGTDHPGVFHALGLDEANGDIVDVHAYQWVLSGDSFVKNYRFPIADALLEGDETHLGVPVPRPEAEYVMFILRIALKSLAPVEILKTNRHYDDVIDELDWLRARTDLDAAAALCAEWFPSVGQDLFRQAEAAVAEKNALGRRSVIGARLAWRLRHLRRLGLIRGAFVHVGRIGAYTLARIQKRKDRVPRSGGLIIALVGPKASGKSTISGGLAKRLGKHLAVVRIHSGKPPATLLTALPRLMVPLARKLFPHERLREYEKPERRKTKRYSLFYVLRMTISAYERRALLLRAHRMATAGTIVISDRYPSRKTGAMDSSCFDDEALAQADTSLKRWLMGLERRFYSDIPAPDMVLRLQAPMELALQRDQDRDKEGGPDPEAVRRRWWIENDVQFSDVPLMTINTDGPVDQSIRDALKTVWSLI